MSLCLTQSRKKFFFREIENQLSKWMSRHFCLFGCALFGNLETCQVVSDDHPEPNRNPPNFKKGNNMISRGFFEHCINIPTIILSKVKASVKLANPRRRLNPMLWYTWATCCNNRTKVISLNDGKYCCKTDISSDPSINFNVVSTFEQSFKGWNSTSK